MDSYQYLRREKIVDVLKLIKTHQLRKLITDWDAFVEEFGKKNLFYENILEPHIKDLIRQSLKNNYLAKTQGKKFLKMNSTRSGSFLTQKFSNFMDIQHNRMQHTRISILLVLIMVFKIKFPFKPLTV